MSRILSLLSSGLLAAGVCAQVVHPPVNVDAAIVQDFEKRVSDYAQVRKTAESKLSRLKTSASQEKISHQEHELREAIRAVRKGARQGDLFTPEITMEIRRLVAIAMHPSGRDIRSSLRSSEPVRLHLEINESYPARVPLQSSPPTLLQNLPALPPEIEYRLTGEDLVLLDTKANLVIDLIRGVFS